jgi:hypothetical protein
MTSPAETEVPDFGALNNLLNGVIRVWADANSRRAQPLD